MWPSDAALASGAVSTRGQAGASAESVSAGVCLVISAFAEPSGWMSVKRERSASMRTLNRSLIGTSGPLPGFSETVLIPRGRHARRLEQRSEDRGRGKQMLVQECRRAGGMIFLIAKTAKSSVRIGPVLLEENYTEAWRIAKSFESHCANRAVRRPAQKRRIR